MSYYAVAKGRNVGIYSSWDECNEQVHKYSGSVFKKFGSRSEAESFMRGNSDISSFYSKTATSYRSSSYATKRFLTDDRGDSKSENVTQKQSKYENKGGFSIDSNGYTKVYTDGACSFNGRGNAKAGVGVWFSEKNAYNVSRPVVGRATNNMAEIQAVTIAAKQAQKAGVEKLKVNTDSKFLISCANEWMPKWKRNGWQTSNGMPVKNKIELMEMEKALAPLKVSWSHIKSHTGIRGNEMADRLARNGAEQYRGK